MTTQRAAYPAFTDVVPQSSTGLWYALYTKPHAERQVANALEQQGIRSYLPTLLAWKVRRRQLEREPLFPCYSFAQIDFTQIGLSAVSWLPGLRCIVNTEGVPMPIPEKVIAYIRQRADELSGPKSGRWASGDRVQIIDGPWRDLEAIFNTQLSGRERALVLIQILGRLTRCEVPLEWLEER